MPTLHNLDNLQCGREPRCQQSNTKKILGSTSGIISSAFLGNGGPALSVSDAAFFVSFSFNSHHLPQSATQAISSSKHPMHHSVADSSDVVPRARPLWVKHKTAYFDHDDKKKTFREFCGLQINCHHLLKFTEPNFLSKLCHGIRRSSSCSSQFARLPRSPSLILFMTCAAKRQSQLSSGLSSAMRTVVCCSHEDQGVLRCRFTSRTAIALRNQCNSSTSLNYTSWSDFMLGPLSHFKMILQYPRSLMKGTRNEMEYAVRFFVRNMSLQSDTYCSRQITSGNVSAVSCVMKP